jgi:hypothetical protein
MVVGAILVELYMLDGIVAVFVLHAVYNLSALALIIVTRKRPFPGLGPGTRPPAKRITPKGSRVAGGTS